MNKIVLFGASALGRAAYIILKNSFDVVNFCDNDPEKWGRIIEGLEVISPSKLANMDNVVIVITSSYSKDIASQLRAMGISDFYNFEYLLREDSALIAETRTRSFKPDNIRLLNLGAFLAGVNTELRIDNMAFLAGGSGLLDYLFLKALMLRLGLRTYLEIGTWMGESISAVSEVADRCYSISMPDDNKEMIDYFRTVLNKDNFSRYFTRGHNNIVHYCVDSKEFDFNEIKDKIDLVFIDGNHSYEGIRNDTEKIIGFADMENTIVVWHDFKDIRNKYIEATVSAIFDALPESMHGNIFAVDANYCGIYIPDKYLGNFDFQMKPNELYSYNVVAKPQKNSL